MFVVLTDACPKGDHLLAPICSVRGVGHDGACVFKAGEHPAIVNESYLLYAKTAKFFGKSLSSKVVALEFTTSGTLSAELLERSIKGLSTSLHVEPWIKKYLKG